MIAARPSGMDCRAQERREAGRRRVATRQRRSRAVAARKGNDKTAKPQNRKEAAHRARLFTNCVSPNDACRAVPAYRAPAAGLPACAVPATAGPYAVSAVLRVARRFASSRRCAA
ncbi:hypothetical protein DM46_1855 [Burkholderia mallei]|nr:hypothetical protein DM46_1855 [Burkholderia mallei]